MTTKPSKPPKSPKPLRHQWVLRPGSGSLCYCTACGIYEDYVTLTSESRSGATTCKAKIYRPYKMPGRRFVARKQPKCVPIEGGSVEAPPPYVDKLMAALRAMSGLSDE